VVLCPEEELLQSDCVIADLNLFDPALARQSCELAAKVRYATPAVPATVMPESDAALRIRFHQPQRAISPGQSVVLYDGDRVAGGGVVQRSL
jgi:tRNA-specific 2-thiouridylase